MVFTVCVTNSTFFTVYYIIIYIICMYVCIYYILCFVHCSLSKSVSDRPKYSTLVEHPLIQKAEVDDFDLGAWYLDLLDREQAVAT